MLDIINLAAKKASDSKSQESKRVTPPDIPGEQSVGPNTIEDDSENKTQNLRNEIKIKNKGDNCPENFNVIRDKTYN